MSREEQESLAEQFQHQRTLRIAEESTRGAVSLQQGEEAHVRHLQASLAAAQRRLGLCRLRVLCGPLFVLGRDVFLYVFWF